MGCWTSCCRLDSWSSKAEAGGADVGMRRKTGRRGLIQDSGSVQLDLGTYALLHLLTHSSDAVPGGGISPRYRYICPITRCIAWRCDGREARRPPRSGHRGSGTPASITLLCYTSFYRPCLTTRQQSKPTIFHIQTKTCKHEPRVHCRCSPTCQRAQG